MDSNFLWGTTVCITKNVLFKYNECSIKMDNNGWESCTVNSRQINIRHFFVKDIVDKEEIELQFCPTHLMIADYFTNTMQVKLFNLFRDLIMVYKHIGYILSDIEFTDKERVWNQNKVMKNSNMKNNYWRTIRFQVRNIDSNLNSSVPSQKRAKNKLTSIHKSK